MTLTTFNQTLASIAIYEQARAHPVKKGQPVTDFPHNPFGLDVCRDHAFFEGVGGERVKQ